MRERESGLTHFDADGNVRMADVSGKAVTLREATAVGRIRVSGEILDAVRNGTMKKGDVLAAAQIAGIMGAKKTAELIPMCHTLQLTDAALRFEADDAACAIAVRCTVKANGRTGVEMEALTGVSAALLTIYDMCKAMDRRIVIEEIRLERKSGGKSGTFQF